MDLIETLRSTGAVREFTAEPVPDEVVARVLDTARFAPSAGATTWRWARRVCGPGPRPMTELAALAAVDRYPFAGGASVYRTMLVRQEDAVKRLLDAPDN